MPRKLFDLSHSFITNINTAAELQFNSLDEMKEIQSSKFLSVVHFLNVFFLNKLTMFIYLYRGRFRAVLTDSQFLLHYSTLLLNRTKINS